MSSDARPNYRLQILRLMWDGFPWLTIAMVVMGVIAGLASISVIDTMNSAIHHPENRGQLLLPFIGLNILAIGLRSCSALLPSYASMRIITALRIALCRRILLTPLEDIERRGVAKVMTLLTHDVPGLARTLLMMPTILVAAATFLFGISYLAYLSWGVFLLTLAAMGAGVVCYTFLFHRGMVFSRRVRDEVNTFSEHTYGLIYGIKELKLNSERRRWFKRAAIDLSSRRVAQYGFIEDLWYSAGANVEQIAFAVLIGFLIFGAPSLQVFDAATLTACVLAVMYVMGPLTTLVGSIPELGSGVIACERLAEFGFSINASETQENEKTKLSAEPDPALQSWNSIELRGVKTDYHDFESATSFVLGPLNLRLEPGEIVFIVGGNGSGKSTLAKILTGLYKPMQGEILLDGRPIDDHSRATYSSLFSAVFTDFHIFKRVVGPGNRAQLGGRAREYLVELGLAEKVRIDGRNYSTTTALSSGQRKRLALLCAYMEDRPIYVLDEWAADQDPIFKRFFYDVLLADLKSRGKCVIVITHDEQYFHFAERIIKLSEGQIISDTVRRALPRLLTEHSGHGL